MVETSDPKFKLMEEEIFAPVLTIHVYDDARLDETLELCDTTSPYALTGAIFAHDRREIVRLTREIRVKNKLADIGETQQLPIQPS